MCGICGIKSGQADPDVLERMIRALHHRGPDSSGRYHGAEYMAGMRRLAVNDLYSGDQPLYNSRKNAVLFYNGEIYNSPELRRGLEARGFSFRTRSDGEAICHLFDLHGEELFSHLDGMFACALWVEDEKKLILARDPAGEKPLYYAHLPGGGLAFASEMKSLLKIPELPAGLDHQALWDFPTFLWIPEPSTAFAAIKSLPGGHILVADAAGVRIHPYACRVAPAPDAAKLGEAERIETVRATVTRAVHSRLLSDVPVGAFLSGGLDSSIVTTLAVERLPRLDTFTIAFDNIKDPYHGMADESEQALATARALGTRHHLLRATADMFRRLLPEFCDKADQPFAVSSGLGVLAISGLAREKGIKVLLTGDGADEAFGGYSWYPFLPHADRTSPAAVPGRPVSFQNTGLSVAERLGALSAMSGPERALAWHYYAAEEEKAALFAADPFHDSRSSVRHFSAFRAAAWDAPDYIRHDRKFYFPFEMLAKADRMTMANSVEGRVPFAAPEVQELAARLPFSDMVRDGELKWILRRAFADKLPAGVADRKKHGFNVPVDHWLKNEWADLLDAAFSPSSSLSRHGFLAKGAGKTARQLRDDPERLNGHTLFAFIMLDLWLTRMQEWR